MKLTLSSLFFFSFFLCGLVYGEDLHKEFTVKVSGIKIGKLVWTIKIDDTNYLSDLKLKSEGVLSGIYRFEGEYYSEGVVLKNKLKPNKYNHIWKTKKITKNMSLVFQGDKLKLLNQLPNEKEKLRVNVFGIKQSKDPLTSFLQILLGEKKSLVVDGRRTYTMSAVINEKTKETVVEISNYSNLWTDHKRRNFEKLTFEKKDGDFFPIKINIYFDGKIFKLE